MFIFLAFTKLNFKRGDNYFFAIWQPNLILILKIICINVAVWREYSSSRALQKISVKKFFLWFYRVRKFTRVQPLSSSLHSGEEGKFLESTHLWFWWQVFTVPSQVPICNIYSRMHRTLQKQYKILILSNLIRIYCSKINI